MARLPRYFAERRVNVKNWENGQRRQATAKPEVTSVLKRGLIRVGNSQSESGVPSRDVVSIWRPLSIANRRTPSVFAQNKEYFRMDTSPTVNIHIISKGCLGAANETIIKRFQAAKIR